MTMVSVYCSDNNCVKPQLKGKKDIFQAPFSTIYTNEHVHPPVHVTLLKCQFRVGFFFSCSYTIVTIPLFTAQQIINTKNGHDKLLYDMKKKKNEIKIMIV